MDEYLARTYMQSPSTEVEIFAALNILRTSIILFCKSGHTYNWQQFSPRLFVDNSIAAHSKEAGHEHIHLILV